MVIRAVIFDCFGVLVTSAKKRLMQDYPQSKTQIDDLGHQFDYGLISQIQFKDSLSELLGISSDDVVLKYLTASVHNEPTVNWVRQLKQSGKYKIGLLSNVGHGYFDQFFSPSDKQELFDQVVLSSDEGMAKPEAMMFELIAKRLDVKTSECVMVDDSPVNIEAAKNVGMQGVYFISTSQAQDELDRILESNRA